jgi:hypothetical protein
LVPWKVRCVHADRLWLLLTGSAIFFRSSKEEAVSDLHHVDQPSQQYFALNPASVTAQLAEG